MGNSLIKLLETLNYTTLLKKKRLLDENNQLTPKALELIGEQSDTEDPFKEWLNLWPKNLLNILGYTVSGNSNNCMIKLKKFMKDTGYNWETIMKATKLYLEHQENKNWEYTKKNYKFISDRDSSTLEAFCEMVEENIKPENDVKFL